jgi:uncharacterized membrane protein
VNTSPLKSTIGAAAVTAAAMYFLDPASGPRRRAMLRDRVTSAFGTASQQTGVAARDLAHRAHGATARARGVLAPDEVSDDVLVERVRAALGRAVSHPAAIEVSASQGRIALAGPVLAHEHGRLMRAVRAVRGVAEIDDRLDLHEHADHISALQGGRPLPKQSPRLDENWAPALRWLATAGGGALVLWGASRRGALGLTTAAVGSALALRGTSNTPLKRLAGMQGRRGIDIRKTLHVNAPLDAVFETLSNYENFPAFMRNVRRVSMHDDGRSHWVVAGPAGFSVEWDAETTVYRPNEALGWRTVRGATVAHAGLIRCEREGNGTRLDIRMTYNPPAGALGHAVAKLFGADAKTELDEDLARLKTFLETGTEPHDAAARSMYGRSRSQRAQGESAPPW